MFGRQQRKHLEALSEIRQELSTADLHARAVLTDAMAQIELRLARDREDRENAQSLVNAQANDLGRLLQQVANTCALVAERLEVDRSERRALSEAIARIVQSPAIPLESPQPVLGGTIVPPSEIEDRTEPAAAADAEPEDEIDLRDPADTPVEVEESTPVEHRWRYGQKTYEDARPTSRPLPRWVTKQS